MATEGVLGRNLGPPERQVTIIGRHMERGGTTIRTSFPVSVPRQQDATDRSSGGRGKLQLPSWAPEVGTGHLFQTHGQTPGHAPADAEGQV